ncbi:hypothetical protein [Paenibacillus qinlingensis]|uniref:hypothetical protein n=1 Tax=Paenibacillus qinlingensis TaxID=1837343 RepID=UPI0015676567|nr:hypothetical protein [Paenibacillus qinlingensis]NQX63504.1 hypothetical protein [Paenibacillus qinlingensis]
MHNDKYMRKLGTLGRGNNELSDLLTDSTEHTEYEKKEDHLVALKKAVWAAAIPDHLDIIHVGEQHIHIFSSSVEAPYVIPNGILDLNHQFNLKKAPNQRQIALCIKWLSCRLPPTLQTFACIGRGLHALQHSPIELEQDLYCLREDFLLFAQQIALQEIHTLSAEYPAKPDWLQEVVALHCVILAGLFKSGASRFMPHPL